jgi:hypothetical protein
MLNLSNPFNYKSIDSLINSIKNAKIIPIQRSIQKNLKNLLTKMLEKVCKIEFFFFIFFFY